MPKKPFQTLNQTIAFSNPFYRIRQDDVVLPNGEQTVYNVVDIGDAVWIVPRTHEGQIVMISQYRYAVDEWCLEVPAGGRPQDDTPEETARRELWEEVGGVADSLTFIGKFWTMKGIGNELGWIYFADGVKLGKPHHEPTEVIEIQKIEQEQAIQMAQLGTIDDAMTCLAILLCIPYL